jgi:hypothetical protein
MRKAVISSIVVIIFTLGFSIATASDALAQPPKDVIVVNPPDTPVPVVLQNNEPFHRFLVGNMADGVFNMGDTLAVVVPKGKRLVLETVSAIVLTSAGQNVRIRIDANSLGFFAAHHLTVSKEPWQNDTDHKGIQSLRMYADPGTTVYFRVSRDQGAGIATVNASISGHLINMP